MNALVEDLVQGALQAVSAWLYMTLADILSRDVSMAWHEAVALVRGVVERLLEKSSEAIAVPELDQIEISATGQISVSGRTNVSKPVRRLGQLLQAMLGYTESPFELRLVVVHATAPSPAFGSIREFDEAVGYFERPGRNAVLQAVYVRAIAAPSADAHRVATLDSIASLPTTDQPEPSRKNAARKSNLRRQQLIAGALLLLVCAGGMHYARCGSIVPQKRNVSAIALKASNAAGAAGAAMVSSPSCSVREESRVKPGAAVTKPAVSLQPAFDLDPPPAVTTATTAADDSIEMTQEVRPGVTFNEELPVYSAESEAVSPPIGVGLQLPHELPWNGIAQDLSRIDVIVSPTGTVDSVKLVGTPHNVHDSMFLSAAKTWTFQPALKDGRPVRYRKTVWVAMQ